MSVEEPSGFEVCQNEIKRRSIADKRVKQIDEKNLSGNFDDDFGSLPFV